MSQLAGRIISLGLRRYDRRLWPALAVQATDPVTTQDAVLRRILAQNATSTFGVRHGFDSIATAREFAEAVPVHDYESIRSLIERQEETGEAVLTNENPVFYARTSGTTGEPKYLPVTPSGLKRQTTAHRLVASLLNRHMSSTVFAERSS